METIMKKILNRFLLATLLALPATQVLGQDQVNIVSKNKLQEIKEFAQTKGSSIKSFVEKNKNDLAASGLLTFSVLASYYSIIEIKNRLSNLISCPINTTRIITSDIILATTALTATGYALELSPDIIKKLELKTEDIIKETRKKIFNLFKDKNNKNLKIALLSLSSAITGYRAYRKITHNEPQYVRASYEILAILYGMSSILTGKLALDVINNK